VQADVERDLLIRELTRAVGLGGRDRRAASASERARASVTRVVRQAIARIRQHYSTLRCISTAPSAPAHTAPIDPTLPGPWSGGSDLSAAGGRPREIQESSESGWSSRVSESALGATRTTSTAASFGAPGQHSGRTRGRRSGATLPATHDTGLAGATARSEADATFSAGFDETGSEGEFRERLRCRSPYALRLTS
jgi:hypothetical protein